MKTGKRRCLAELALMLITPAALVFAEVRSGLEFLNRNVEQPAAV